MAITLFKVIQGRRFWSQPVCDFLLVNNTDLHPISHRFQDYITLQYLRWFK